MCSDGLHGSISDRKIREILQETEGTNPKLRAQELREAVWKRGAEDNMTLILLECG